MPTWAVLLLKRAASDPKQFIKDVVGLLMGLLAAIIVIGIIALNMIASLLEHVGVVRENEDLTQTEIYLFLDEIHTDYLDELREAEQKIEDKIIEANTYTELEEQEVTDPETGKTHTELVEVDKCDVSVTKQVNSINYAYYLSYINYDSEVMWGEKYDTSKENRKSLESYTRTLSVLTLDYGKQYEIDLLDKGAVEEMLEEIGRLGRVDEEIQTARLENKIMTVQEAADKFFPDDPENQEYVVSFELYCDFLEFYDAGQGGVDIDGGDYEGKEDLDQIIDQIGEDEVDLGVPKYYQNRFRDYAYGNGTIASSGCAPTAIAMCLSYLLKQSITPPDVVDWTGNRYYVSGQGSSWAIFDACAKHWGVGCSTIGRNAESIMAALKEGRPVIASMGPGTFTKGGHLIVIRGFTSDGYFIVNDPNEGNFKKYGTEKFSFNTVLSQAKQFWAYG